MMHLQGFAALLAILSFLFLPSFQFCFDRPRQQGFDVLQCLGLGQLRQYFLQIESRFQSAGFGGFDQAVQVGTRLRTFR